MKVRFVCLITFATASVALLGGNRPVPKWQGFANRPLAATTECAGQVLGRFGRVIREDGEEPEAGSVRLILRTPTGRKSSRSLLTAYFDGDAGFTSAFMDATDYHIAEQFWRALQGVRAARGPRVTPTA